MALGEVTILLFLLFVLIIFCVAVIIILSIKDGKFHFPKLLLIAFQFMENAVHGICKLMGLDEKELMLFFILLHNRMFEDDFSKVSIENRAVFLPHCIRSVKCPADLTPEGLSCKRCGRCDLGHTIKELEGMGYKVFIVPGSSFIRRMAKKYRPQAIIGVGCLREVRDGLKFADKIGIIAMGVVNKTEGCIETLADWPELMKVASLEIPRN